MVKNTFFLEFMQNLFNRFIVEVFLKVINKNK